jgi:cytochrome P450
VLFPKGTFVFPSFVAANFDADVWADPDRFDITKESSHTPHLTFGSGIHYCLGAWLARAELQEALPVLAERWPNLRLNGEVEWKPPQFGIWGPARLPIAW